MIIIPQGQRTDDKAEVVFAQFLNNNFAGISALKVEYDENGTITKTCKL